ncbi:Cytosolic endo-beta-N-acetylglucosaminidase [Porphyridium purpureum]|uniref:Cytosolic endo-beta-N-acetylglucosaminidase n=1 Tax=Porphyridium purpureum TaxID=35688 RepID=A0A5J4Z6D2_PORPP|nr:Cytosolic endo-beta-N-acetylglucosaminidase [Porphyridium purpureum]|eukprot:POR6173..scf295_1
MLTHDFCGNYAPHELLPRGARLSSSCARALVQELSVPSSSRLWKFTSWDCIDYFCYFAHAVAAPPPACWIAVAHRNHVSALGSLVFEGEQGAHELFELLQEPAHAATQLASITKYWGFDGWLVNVECDIRSPAHRRALLALVRALQALCTVVWYDAVTLEGRLEWQNELNECNEAFFLASDMFFSNYAWTCASLVRTQQRATHLRRSQDVFMGIDVFGRGTYGGGGFNTPETLALVHMHGLSCAIFAPGWTHECATDTGATEDSSEARERVFWIEIGKRVPQRASILRAALPFSTNFDLGWGRGTWAEGLLKSPDFYVDLEHRQSVLPRASEQPGVISYCSNIVWDGGYSLRIESLNASGSPESIHLFKAALRFRPGEVLHIRLVYEDSSAQLCLRLGFACQGALVPLHLVPATQTSEIGFPSALATERCLLASKVESREGQVHRWEDDDLDEPTGRDSAAVALASTTVTWRTCEFAVHYSAVVRAPWDGSLNADATLSLDDVDVNVAARTDVNDRLGDAFAARPPRIHVGLLEVVLDSSR